MNRILPLIACILFGLGPMLVAVTPPSRMEMDRAQIVDKFVWDCVEPFNASSLNKVRHLGHLLCETRSKSRAPNDHSFVIHWHTFKFEGLMIKGAMNRGTFDTTHAVITSGKWAVPLGLKVGATKAQLIRQLSVPLNSSTVNRFDYRGETEEAHFTLVDGVIARIELFVYSD